MTYATLNQLKSALRLTDNIDDTNLELALHSAEEMINTYCGRTFGTAGTATSRVYAPGLATEAEIDDCTSITTVEWSTDGANWTTTSNYQPEPLNSWTDGMPFPFTRIRATGNWAWPVYAGIATLRVTGLFAFGSVPTSITQATILQASRIFARLSSPLGVAGFNDGIGAVQVKAGLDVDVMELLNPYRRFRAAL